MKRRHVRAGIAGIFALLLVPTAAQARASFDAASGTFTMPKDGVRAIGFEPNEALDGVQLATWNLDDPNDPTLDVSPLDAATAAKMTTSGPDDSVEGQHALSVGKNGSGILFTDAKAFEALRDGKVEVTLWARADGSAPLFEVTYGNDASDVSLFGTFAAVRGVRTGRATSDGWAEYSTGPIDGSVWGQRLQAVALLPSPYANANDAFVVDAIEIRKVAGEPIQPLACTQQNVDTVCGAEGDCMFGHCISSTVTWGVLPSAQQRHDIAERWIHFATRVIGDRNAEHHGIDILTPNARALAVSATSSRQFFGGLNRLVNLLRDNHTSFGAPGNYTTFAPQVQYGSASALGACFGVVEKDLLGGGRGYGVFRSVQNPLSGVQLQRGDVVFSIDGRDPKEWVDETWPSFASTLPNDPASDWGASADALSRLISTRASTVTIVRCASSTSCTGTDRKEIKIDVSKTIYDAIVNDVPGGGQFYGCTSRYTPAIDGAEGGSSDGTDIIHTSTGPQGETRVQFDGFVGTDKWKSSWAAVFNPKPAKVLVDARMGHGGYEDNVQALLDLVRGTSDPVGVSLFGRPTYDLDDPSWLFSRLSTCSNGETAANQWECFQGGSNGFFTSVAAPPGATSKIAWMNTEDVSANDFMPRLLKGHAGFKIFAPHPTSGAFGAIGSLPGIWTGWGGASMQMQDGRFAATLADAESARWESGHGVEPDFVTTEKMSDAIAGVDTLLEAATAWLAQP